MRKSLTMAETPDSNLSPSSTQFKKQYPHLPTSEQQQQQQSIPGPLANQITGADGGVAMGNLSLRAMEEGASDVVVRSPQMVSLDGVAGGGAAGVVAWSKSQLKVLVVDDAEMNRKMLAALLTRSGISSDSVADGQLAVAAVAAIEGGK